MGININITLTPRHIIMDILQVDSKKNWDILLRKNLPLYEAALAKCNFECRKLIARIHSCK